ncbi:hypothetical protein HYH02_012144 [Chlamydomonas schloesseri]|uniref:Protein kinase domain-containing protein n=1 Tax=Chlamydomonas schloesseri TaxID=2026947 RepID=A0A835SXI0_9CHLO|nr:hypothetical protein HYH02_012144 [Chlamydomonas schloesseri]|eukprot:KAG2434948.1 hypothetical protein HYH02_012144 [Chlamydomonas schloesseri]
MTCGEAAGFAGGGGIMFGRQGSSLTPTAGNGNSAAAAGVCTSPSAAAPSSTSGPATTAAPLDKSIAAALLPTTQSPRSHHGLSSSHGASSGTTSLAAMAMRTAPPDPFSLVCRNAATPANLQPGDLLALPVRHGGRLVAALLLGWAIHGGGAAGTAGPQPALTAVAADDSALGAGNLHKPPPNSIVTAASLLASATRANGGSAVNGPDATCSTVVAPVLAGEAPLQPAGTEAGASSSGMTLIPGELGQLSRLAQFLVFGLYAEPQHARTLETVAASLSGLPYCTGLHDFVAGLLEAVPELLQIRFSLRFAPIMFLTHGLGASGPAVLFASRAGGTQQGQQQQQQSTAAAAAAAAAAAVMAGDGSLGTMELFPQTLGSAAASTRPADGGDASAAVSRVRAVRMSLHHTLLAEALKPAAKLRRSVEIGPPVPAAAGGGGGGGGAGAGAGGQGVGHPQFMPFSAVSSHYAVTGPQLPSIAINSAIDEGVSANHLPNGGPGGVGAGPPSAPPLPPLVIPSTQPIYFTVVPNISSHMLEEGAPCRDLLLCANLAGCAMGSLVLAVEAPAPSAGGAVAGSTAAGSGAPAAAPGAMAAMAASGNVGAGAQAASLAAGGASVAAATTAGASNGAGFVGLGLANASMHRGSFNNLLSTAGSIPAPVLLTAPLSVLHSSRQFGMYLVCSEPLPAPLLQLVAAELQQLLEMVLGACREGVLSLLGGGRCAVELYSLQEQLLGNNSAAAGGSAAIAGHIAGAMAAALSAPSPLATGPAGATAPQAASAAMGPGTLIASRSGLGPGTSARQALARSFAAPHGRAIPRSLFHLAAGALPVGSGVGAGGGVGVGLNTTGADQFSGAVRSAGSPRLQLSQMGPSALLATQRNISTRGGGGTPGAVAAAGALLMSHQGHMHGHTPGHGEGLDGSVESLAQGVSGVDADGGMCWMLASSPEVMLEPPGAGPSPLEVMVSSMRTGLTAALTNAMVLDSSDEAKAAMNQELAAIRLYDVIGRGGQGVVFHGTLHGLETAVKVIVHRGKGEPLAHDGGDPAAGGAEGSGADAGAAAAAAGAADAAGGADGADGRNSAGDLSRIRKAKRGALELVVTGTLSSPHIVQVLASFSDVIMVRCTYRNEPTPRLRLVAKDDPILAGWASPGPLNTVACLEYCDAGTLLEAAHAGAFRPPGSSVLSGAVRPALVPLYMSLLEVALALRYLHNRRLVHCDLKPANVLLKSSSRDPRGWTCKLSDFGCVRLMTELPATPEDLAAMQQQQQQQAAVGGGRGGGAAAALSGRGGARPGATGANAAGSNLKKTVLGFRVAQPLGTIAYMSPESFIRGHTLGPGVDVYAFGILMYELLMCRAPYQGIDAQALPRMVLRQNLRPEFHPLAPPEYCHLAARCWSSSVTRRPNTVQLVSEIEALLAEAQLKESRKTSMQPRPGASSVPPAGGATPAPPAVRPPHAGAAAVAAPLPAMPAIPAAKPAMATQQAQSPSHLAAPGSNNAASGAGAAAGGGQELAVPTRAAQGSGKPSTILQPEPAPANAAAPSKAVPVAAAPAEPQVALASIEPAGPEINELVTAAAAAAGLDATVEVLQVKVPPGTEPAAECKS